MRTSVRRTLCATAIAGGFTVLGFAFATASASAADTPSTTSGAAGVISGNQTSTGGTAPVKASGNQVTVIGHDNNNRQANGHQATGNTGRDTGNRTTDGRDGTASGNQTDTRGTAPVQASGNQVTVIGHDNNNAGGSEATGTSGSGNTTTGEDGTASGNQTDTRDTAPVQASGNQVTVIGNDNTGEADEPGTGSEAPGPGTGEGTGPGTDPGTEPGIGQGTDPGSDPGTDDNQQGGAAEETSGTADVADEAAAAAAAGPAVSAVASLPARSATLAPAAETLPQTGLSSELLPLGGAGFAILMVGLLLVLGSRRTTGSRPGQGVLSLG